MTTGNATLTSACWTRIVEEESSAVANFAIFFRVPGNINTFGKSSLHPTLACTLWACVAVKNAVPLAERAIYFLVVAQVHPVPLKAG
jgi:hypothetical protein